MGITVFLDRDGTINRDVGYLNHPDQLQLIPRSGEAVRMLNDAGYTTVVISNQSGIGKGFLKEEFLSKIHKRFLSLLAQEGAKVDGFYYCPHDPHGFVEKYKKACQCRKPQPGLLKRAAAEIGIELARSFVIGDKICDVELAHNVGAKGILVKTGHGARELYRLRESKLEPPEYIGDDLYDAVQWILHDSVQ